MAVPPDLRMAEYQARAMLALVEEGVWERETASPQVEQFVGGSPGVMAERVLRTLLERWPEDATIAGCLDKLDPVNPNSKPVFRTP